LQNDGTVIVLVICKMNRASGNLDSVSQGRFVDVMTVVTGAAKGWNERGVNVHHATTKIVGDVKELKKTSKTDKIHAASTAAIKNVCAEFFAGSIILRRDHGRRPSGLLRSLQPECIRPVRDDQHPLRRQASVRALVEKIL